MAFPVEPMPPLRAVRFGAPEEAHDASYFAASARISSFCDNERGITCSLFVLCMFGVDCKGRGCQLAWDAPGLTQKEPLSRRAIEPVLRKGGTSAYATGTRAEVLESAQIRHDPDAGARWCGRRSCATHDSPA